MRYFLLILLALLLPCPVFAGQLEEGTAAYDHHDYNTALKLLQPLADQGYAEAQFEIGRYYTFKSGHMDHEKAALWYKKSAEQDYNPAQYALCWLLLEKKDYQEAYFWLKVATRYYHSVGLNKTLSEIPSKLAKDQITAVDKRVKEWRPASAPTANNCSTVHAIDVAKSDPRLNFCAKEKYGCAFEATRSKQGWFITVTRLDEKGVKSLAVGSEDTVAVSYECNISGFHHGR